MTALVEDGFRCVAYDRRGHGRSSQPGGGYDYDTLADDLAAVLDALDLRDVTLVGMSMAGGEITRYLTRHGRARIARVVYVVHRRDAVSHQDARQPGRHPARDARGVRPPASCSATTRSGSTTTAPRSSCPTRRGRSRNGCAA